MKMCVDLLLLLDVPDPLWAMDRDLLERLKCSVSGSH